MAYKTLLFGTDDLYDTLKPLYYKEVKRGNLDIIAIAELKGEEIKFVYADGSRENELEDISIFDLAIISSNNKFYNRMEKLEKRGLPREKIIDGRVFQVPNLDFARLLEEGIAYGVFKRKSFTADAHPIYPQSYEFKGGNLTLSLGMKSSILGGTIEGRSGEVSFGKFCSIGVNTTFELGRNYTQNYHNIATYSLSRLDWKPPKSFLPPEGTCKILFGNDVLSGSGCFFKCTNINKPLIIGDGAVIATNSVVVKNVPPYAVVGGNPAQIIKYRFEPEDIESLLRIKWWDWSLDKIHENFTFFNRIERFVALHDE